MFAALALEFDYPIFCRKSPLFDVLVKLHFFEKDTVHAETCVKIEVNIRNNMFTLNYKSTVRNVINTSKKGSAITRQFRPTIWV